MKRVLFIDRDGTLVVEPPVDYQLDSFGKLEFVPKAIGSMSRIATLGFELVMATNQDGLDEGAYVYYVHSYAPQTNADTIARTTYGETFSAAIRRDNFFGTQFHPEKSASDGERILQNFLRI